MLRDYLNRIEDHRDPQGREYKLADVLMVSILGILSGAKGYKDIARFAEIRLKELEKYLNIKWKRSMDYSAIRKVLVRINPDDIEAALRAHAEDLKNINETEQKRHICFDGKALRGSFSHTKDQRASYVFQAFSATDNLVLATADIGDKENEIAYFQQMIQEMDLKDVYITADAMHCQKKLLS